MGNWYTNVCIKGSAQNVVVSALDELGRRAYVTPEITRWPIVYDPESDKFDLNELESLTKALFTRLSCVVRASFNADDDVLWLGAYEKGTLTTRYASDRRLFEDGLEFPAIDKVAKVLCRIFERNIRRRPPSVLGLLSVLPRVPFAYVAAVLRHRDLADVLGFPQGSVGLGYKYVDRGEAPEGLNRERLQKPLSS